MAGLQPCRHIPHKEAALAAEGMPTGRHAPPSSGSNKITSKIPPISAHRNAASCPFQTFDCHIRNHSLPSKPPWQAEQYVWRPMRRWQSSKSSMNHPYGPYVSECGGGLPSTFPVHTRDVNLQIAHQQTTHPYDQKQTGSPVGEPVRTREDVTSRQPHQPPVAHVPSRPSHSSLPLIAPPS